MEGLVVCSGSMILNGIAFYIKGIFPGITVPSCVAYKPISLVFLEII